MREFILIRKLFGNFLELCRNSYFRNDMRTYSFIAVINMATSILHTQMTVEENFWHVR